MHAIRHWQVTFPYNVGKNILLKTSEMEVCDVSYLWLEIPWDAILTHLSRVSHIRVIKLSLTDAKPLSEPMLDYC